MALDGLLLRRAVLILQENLPAKIQRIYNLSENEVLFNLKTPQGKKQLLISCHSVHNRLQFTQTEYIAPPEPLGFVMILRKHLEDAMILSVHQVGFDRIAQFNVQKRDDLGDLHDYTLVVELMGKYANLILVSEEGRIIDALKRIPPFENTKRTIQPGALYEIPEAPQKLNPFTLTQVNTKEPLTHQIDGVSPLLSKELEYRLLQGENVTTLLAELKTSEHLFIHEKESESLAHLIPLKHLNLPYVEVPFMDGYDQLYQALEEKERIKQHTGDLIKFIQREYKRHQSKLPKLQEALDEALDCAKYQRYGDYLYAYGSQVKSGQTDLEVSDFETSETIHIPLDPRYDGKENAKRYYQKYHKGRKGQDHIRKQMELTQAEIDYFGALLEQLSFASVQEALEIKDELIQQGYLPNKQRVQKRKHVKASYTHCLLENGVHLYFGKNNLQNETLSFKVAHRNDTWLHAQAYHGAHVILQMENPDEASLRSAAQIAAYYSKARQGSSVPIDYCLVKELKKIPGAKPGMVRMGSHKTIYIDPDENFVLRLIQETKVND